MTMTSSRIWAQACSRLHSMVPLGKTPLGLYGKPFATCEMVLYRKLLNFKCIVFRVAAWATQKSRDMSASHCIMMSAKK